jgi:hypothetical protein
VYNFFLVATSAVIIIALVNLVFLIRMLSDNEKEVG